MVSMVALCPSRAPCDSGLQSMVAAGRPAGGTSLYVSKEVAELFTQVGPSNPKDPQKGDFCFQSVCDFCDFCRVAGQGPFLRFLRFFKNLIFKDIHPSRMVDMAMLSVSRK